MDTDFKVKSTILIVDDHVTDLQFFINSLKDSQWKIYVADNGESAIHQAERIHPDLILLDVVMPGLDGFETCYQLRQTPQTQDIPVIFMTAINEAVDKDKGFEVGGTDYITKPFETTELLARVGTHLQLRQALRQLGNMDRELRAANRQLVTYQQELEFTARTDPLTRLSNRRDSMERLFTEYSRARRYHHPLTIILGDIDHFKQFNETFGHACGDIVLRSVAHLLRETIRAQDHAGRWGDEEFLLMLPETARAGAINIMERLRSIVANNTIHHGDLSLSVTMTWGGHSIDEQDTNLDAALTRAKQALDQGKSKGRNRIVLL